MLEFYGNKGIKQEYSNTRTPQQNGVAKRMNMTLIEAARTMLADSLLPTTFWAEAVKSPFDLEAFSDSDYGGSNLDRKSTTCGCQFLRQRLISWQCKKQTIVATSTTKAEYVAAANCYGQVLWVQNQLPKSTLIMKAQSAL
ncbi:putative ribonuclease H-like domain-containing protein [Tanacetum coccineum]